MISIDDMNYSFLVAPRSNADKPRESVSSDPFRARRRRLSLSGPAVCILTLLACCTRSPELSLSDSRVLQLQSHARRGVGGVGRGAQALGEFAAPPVRPSVSLSCLLSPFRVLPRASRAVHLPRLPFSLPPPRPRRLLPLSKSPLASRMDTRGRVRLHRRVCASLLCLCLFFPFILREKRRYDTIFGRLSRDDGFLVGNVELASRV